MIIKNLLPIDYSNQISNMIDSLYFPWYYQEFQVKTNNDPNQSFGFTHIFFKDEQITSNFFNELLPLINTFVEKLNIKVKNIYRLQANLLCNQNENEDILKNNIHYDIDDKNFISFVYYVIDSDGDTIIYNNDMTIKETANPIMNNCIYFYSNNLHQANPPKNHKKRIVINCILELE
jgi:hypothetical protein